MAEYRAKPGQEDRHGEMTGAITFNMIFVMGPLIIWCVILGPIWFDLKWTLIIGLSMGVVLTLIGMPLSRWAWARFSEWSDRI
ncbi:MAG: hypothetical protein IT430_15480 [Phycisphaerales bacterium]|nr:hypothetical protein [Phycisphaerales bacterium]